MSYKSSYSYIGDSCDYNTIAFTSNEKFISPNNPIYLKYPPFSIYTYPLTMFQGLKQRLQQPQQLQPQQLQPGLQPVAPLGPCRSCNR